MDAIANIMNLFIFVFCILFVNIDKTVVCTSVKSIKSLSLSLSLSLVHISTTLNLLGGPNGNYFSTKIILEVP